MLQHLALSLVCIFMLVFEIGSAFLASEEKEQRYRSHE